MPEQSFTSSFIFCSPNAITELGQLVITRTDGITGTTYADSSLLKLIDRNANTVLTTTGETQIEISCASSLVNFVYLKNINWKWFSTAFNFGPNLSITSGPTTQGFWINNSDTNLVLKLAATTTVSSIRFTMASCTSNDAIFTVGEIYIGNGVFDLPRNPAASNYTPQSSGMREEIKTADGGAATYQIQEKFKADLKLKYIDHSTQTDLHNLWQTSTAYEFIPFPTCTGWKGESYEVNWVGAFDFYENAYNDRTNPLYNGVIRLRETPL